MVWGGAKGLQQHNTPTLLLTTTESCSAVYISVPGQLYTCVPCPRPPAVPTEKKLSAGSHTQEMLSAEARCGAF